MKKNPQVALFLKNVEKTYKSSDYSTTFTASRVAKEWDNTVELAFGVFFCAKIKHKLNRIHSKLVDKMRQNLEQIAHFPQLK